MLEPADIERIAAAVANRMDCTGSHCRLQIFSEEETLMLRRWVKLMDDTGIWLVKIIRYGVVALIGIGVWLAIKHGLLTPEIKGA